MNGDLIILVPILLPVICGICTMFYREKNHTFNRIWVFTILAIDLAAMLMIASTDNLTLTLFSIREGLNVYFAVDMISKIFGLLICIIWPLVALAAFEYMHHEKDELQFFGFYMIVGGALTAMALAGNLFSMYLFYEMITLTSMPLVLHARSHESIMAALKYTFYSVAGAFLVLFGIFVISANADSTVFVPGGFMQASQMPHGLLLAAVFCMIVGFGTKAGMFPMHGWLPTAHPVAPAPASAVLSGVITKAGVLGIIRVVFYVAGPDLIRGTWVQIVWLILILITIFMGSMMAYKEKVLKKRLAYSTVSQVSYVLFGLAILHPIGFVGALFHMIAHSLAKNTLFVSAGAIIYRTGYTKVNQLLGIGKKMPITIWCFTIVSLSLIGIPPTAAFVSKWYLAVGALDTGIPVIAWLGPVILLVSALLTAGYLLSIVMQGFFPGEDFDYAKLEKKEPTWQMWIPLVVMAGASVLFGIWPNGLIDLFMNLANTLLG